MISGEWFNTYNGLKYRVIIIVNNNVFVRDYKGDIAYEDIAIFDRDYQKVTLGK